MAKNTETKGIAFKGIERINTRINTNDGACEEIINVRPEGNTWNNVKDRTKIQDLVKIREEFTVPDYEIIIHPASEEKYYIFWDKVLGVFLLDRTSSFPIDYGDINRICVKLDVEGKILSVSYLDNVLIICTEEGKYYFLWEDDQYERLEIEKCRVNIEAEAVPHRDSAERDENMPYVENGVTIGNNLIAYHYNRGKSLYPVYKHITGLDFDKSKVKYTNIQSLAKDYINRFRESSNIIEGKEFTGMSLYRVALKMYDGSYINYSNIVFANTNGDDRIRKSVDSNAFPMTIVAKTQPEGYGLDIDFYTDVVCTYNIFGKHKITIKIDDLVALQTLMSKKIIESVDVFMTRPILSIDFDKLPTILNAESLSEQRVGNCLVLKTWFPNNIDGFRKEFNNGTYYKILSYKAKDLTARKIEEIDSEVIKNLETNRTLPTPNTDNLIISRNNFNYNNKQHLYDLKYKIFNGYELQKCITLEPQMYRNYYTELLEYIEQNISAEDYPRNKVLGTYYVVKGKYNNKNFVIKKAITNPGNYIGEEIIGGATWRFWHFPKLFSYPGIEELSFGVYIFYQNNKSVKLADKTYYEIFGGGNTNFISDIYTKDGLELITENDCIKVNKSLAHDVDARFTEPEGNFLTRKSWSWFIDDKFPLYYSTEMPDGIKIGDVTEKDIVEIDNILQLTETDNPFVFPSAENYNVGEKIMALNISNGLTTDRNFGTYPLYVLTRDGVYTMSVGEDNTAYSRIIQLNNYKVKNREVLNTPNGIMFLSEEGLMLMNGKSINCISNLVKGKPTMNRYASDMAYITPMDSDFLLEIANSQMYYDEEHAEVNVVVKGYTYVYNIKLGNWYKRADKYKVERNNKLTRIDVSTDAEGYRYKNIALYEIKEGDEVKDNVMIFTKPLALDTRQSKHIERTIVDMQWMTDENFSIQIWASNDGVNYKVVKEYINDQKSGKPFSMQDVYLARVLGSMKYISLMITGKLSDIRLQSAMIQFKQVRNVIGIK